MGLETKQLGMGLEHNKPSKPVFSPAYIRHVGPTSLQYRLFFDVGMGGV